MKLRSGISATDDDFAGLRDSVNGWFADAANELLFVPRAEDYEVTGVTNDGNDRRTVYHKKKTKKPDFVLGAASFTTSFGTAGCFYTGGVPLQYVQTASFRVRSNLGEVPRKYQFVACYSDGTSLNGPRVGIAGTLPGGGLPITV